MYNVRELNIWKTAEVKTDVIDKAFREMNLADLCLSARSYNSLRRAGCNTVGDVLQIMGDDGEGLRKIRNLGARSEAEIRETLSRANVES